MLIFSVEISWNYLFGLCHNIWAIFHQKFHNHGVFFRKMEYRFPDFSRIMDGLFAFSIGSSYEFRAFYRTLFIRMNE